MRTWLFFALILSIGCQAKAQEPLMAPTHVQVMDETWPVALSGQSNAVYLQPYLAQTLPIIGASQGSTAIKAWAPGGEMWQQLEPQLHRPLRAFIFWQGESDEDHLTDYEYALQELIERVRQVNGNQGLAVIICGANGYPHQEDLRASQRLVAELERAIYVPSDDLPISVPPSQHLSAEGYTLMAQRLMQILAHEQ